MTLEAQEPGDEGGSGAGSGPEATEADDDAVLPGAAAPPQDAAAEPRRTRLRAKPGWDHWLGSTAPATATATATAVVAGTRVRCAGARRGQGLREEAEAADAADAAPASPGARHLRAWLGRLGLAQDAWSALQREAVTDTDTLGLLTAPELQQLGIGVHDAAKIVLAAAAREAGGAPSRSKDAAGSGSGSGSAAADAADADGGGDDDSAKAKGTAGVGVRPSFADADADADADGPDPLVAGWGPTPAGQLGEWVRCKCSSVFPNRAQWEKHASVCYRRMRRPKTRS